jgi:squalene-associated FAD-dependent desaturase
MRAPDVAVVGAGFAGLSAAAALADAGARVLVVDARPQLGGRATAFADRETGELVDNGQHVLFGCYRETLAFLRRVGADDHVTRERSLAVPFVDRAGRRSELRCPALPAPLHLLAGVLRWPAIPLRDRLTALRMAGPLRAARRTSPDGGHAGDSTLTVSQWLRRHGQSATLIEWLWEPLAVAALNQSIDEAAAAPFVRVLAEMFGPDAAASALVLPNRPLHLMYAEPARAYIESRGGTVCKGTLARIAVEGSRVAGIHVRGERVAAPAVVCAVPWFAMRSVFGSVAPAALSDIVDAAAAMTSKPIVTVNLWYDRPVMDEPFVGLPGRAMQWVFDKRFAFAAATSHLSLVSSGADALTGEGSGALVARAAGEVNDALPAARSATLLRGTVVREKQATFSLAPGQPRRPGTTTPVDGLVLAGDWIDTGLPGTIESAVVSGHRAAAVIVRGERAKQDAGKGEANWTMRDK